MLYFIDISCAISETMGRILHFLSIIKYVSLISVRLSPSLEVKVRLSHLSFACHPISHMEEYFRTKLCTCDRYDIPSQVPKCQS